MALAQLIYVSRRTPALNLDALREIVAKAARTNARRDITGILMCAGQNLMQILEGEVASIVDRFEIIRADPRHFNVQCLVCKNVNKRMFQNYRMLLVDADTIALLDRRALMEELEDLHSNLGISGFPVEARILLGEFMQLCHAGASNSNLNKALRAA